MITEHTRDAVRQAQKPELVRLKLATKPCNTGNVLATSKVPTRKMVVSY